MSLFQWPGCATKISYILNLYTINIHLPNISIPKNNFHLNDTKVLIPKYITNFTLQFQD